MTTVPIMWGLNFVTTKMLLGHWDALALVTVRFAAIAPLALVWAYAARPVARVERRDWIALAAGGALGIALYQFCFIFSLERTTVFASSLLASVFPLFTMIGAAAIGEERPSALRWSGAIVALAGIAIFEGLFAGHAGFRPGDLLALAASLTFAPYTLIARRLRTRYSPVLILAWTTAIGTPLIAAVGTRAALQQNYAALDATDWLLFAYVVIFPILVGYALLNWAIAQIGAGPASMYAFGVPIVGGFVGAAVFRTAVPAYEIIGAILCIGGLVIAQLAGERASA
jgi:drug/metabolite transporter (DMT)-like permease